MQGQGEPAGVESRYPRRNRTTVLGPDALQGKSQGTEEEEESASDQVRTGVIAQSPDSQVTSASLFSHCRLINPQLLL